LILLEINNKPVYRVGTSEQLGVDRAAFQRGTTTEKRFPSNRLWLFKWHNIFRD